MVTKRGWVDTLGATALSHNFSGGNGSVRGEFFAQTFVIDRVIEILDVQVDSLVAVQTFDLHLFEFTPQFCLPLVALLGSAHEERFACSINNVFKLHSFIYLIK